MNLPKKRGQQPPLLILYTKIEEKPTRKFQDGSSSIDGTHPIFFERNIFVRVLSAAMDRSFQKYLDEESLLMKRMLKGSLFFVLAACGSQEPSRQKVINGIIYDQDSDRDGVNLGVVRIWVKKGASFYSCTATRVSDTVFLTAAHCLKSENGATETGVFIKSGYAPSYSALADFYAMEKWEVHPRYAGAGQYDLGLFKVKASEVPRLSRIKVAPVSFSLPTYYSDVDMYGYGCAALHTQPDGHKRYGTAFLLDPTVLGSKYRYVNLTPAQGFDPTEAALCQGDSGGPLVQGGRVIGVNTGNDPEYSFFARLDFDDVKSWYANFRDRP